MTGKKTGKVKITVTAKANKKLKKSVTMKVKDLKPTSIQSVHQRQPYMLVDKDIEIDS